MSKYDKLWEYLKNSKKESVALTFSDIAKISGAAMDHSFLKYKKELLSYGYKTVKISLKEEIVFFTILK